jgi:hypothetical protein
MLVLTSCQTNEVAPEAERVRNIFQGGKVIRLHYQVVQRMCHAFYMMWFNAIDILNKLALGNGKMVGIRNGVQDELKKLLWTHFP